MKGLLLKDFFSLTKQMKVIFVFVLAFAFLPGFSMTAFAIVYAAMFPITALGFDERSKWDNLAAMMPYSKTSLVMSKYLLGYFSILIVAVISIFVELFLPFVRHTQIQMDNILAIIFIMLLATILQSINLPFMFKMGVEKGRMAFIVISILIICGAMGFSSNITNILISLDKGILLSTLVACVVTLIVNIASIMFSVRIYRAKK